MNIGNNKMIDNIFPCRLDAGIDRTFYSCYIALNQDNVLARTYGSAADSFYSSSLDHLVGCINSSGDAAQLYHTYRIIHGSTPPLS